MARHESQLVRRTAAWLRRLNHRRGYGIHSPFAFQLVTQVIYERGTFLAYAPLAQRRGDAVLLEKDDRLLLRLANDRQPRTLLVVGPRTDCSRRYLQAGCRTARLAQIQEPAPDALQRLMEARGGADMIYLDAGAEWPSLVRAALPYTTPRTLIVVHDIRATRRLRRAWTELLADPRVRVSFDLQRFGLLFFDPHRAKQHYVVSYF